ncbi:hypothetical protein, partial [Mycobacterium arosiense]|uniref:hypothetical protein n=1 Tax=Mycobacterium arosiense TaxID=425468 RepID=UPI001B808455
LRSESETSRWLSPQTSKSPDSPGRFSAGCPVPYDTSDGTDLFKHRERRPPTRDLRSRRRAVEFALNSPLSRQITDRRCLIFCPDYSADLSDTQHNPLTSPMMSSMLESQAERLHIFIWTKWGLRASTLEEISAKVDYANSSVMR